MCEECEGCEESEARCSLPTGEAAAAAAAAVVEGPETDWMLRH